MSADIIVKLIPNLLSIALTNLTSQKTGLHTILTQIIKSIGQSSKKLMKFKITNMSLRNEALMDSICNVFET